MSDIPSKIGPASSLSEVLGFMAMEAVLYTKKDGALSDMQGIHKQLVTAGVPPYLTEDQVLEACAADFNARSVIETLLETCPEFSAIQRAEGGIRITWNRKWSASNGAARPVVASVTTKKDRVLGEQTTGELVWFTVEVSLCAWVTRPQERVRDMHAALMVLDVAEREDGTGATPTRRNPYLNTAPPLTQARFGAVTREEVNTALAASNHNGWAEKLEKFGIQPQTQVDWVQVMTPEPTVKGTPGRAPAEPGKPKAPKPSNREKVCRELQGQLKQLDADIRGLGEPSPESQAHLDKLAAACGALQEMVETEDSKYRSKSKAIVDKVFNPAQTYMLAAHQAAKAAQA